MSVTIVDPRIKAIKIESDKKDRKEHNTAVGIVASSLFESMGMINYDHIKMTLPKTRGIPLEVITRKWRKRADIAFYLPTGTLAHVEINIYKKGSYITIEEYRNLQNLKQEE